MKRFLSVIFFLCGLVSTRAEEWGVKYTLPSERDGFLAKVIPTLEDIPHIDLTFKENWLFEGCEYQPKILGVGRNSDRLTTYWCQLGIPDSKLKLCFGLLFTGPSGDNNLPVKSGAGFTVFLRW